MVTTTPTTPGSPASRVMELVRCLGMAKRDELTRRTGLSAATVARATAALVDAGLLRYGIPRSNGAGRPGVLVQVDERRFAVIGIHLGRRATTVALGDLTGEVCASGVEPRRGNDLARLGTQVTKLLAAHPERQPLAAGLVAPWRELGWDRAAVAGQVDELLGLDLIDAEHIDAMATAEFRTGRPPLDPDGTTAFVYARETAGFVVVDHHGERVDVARHSSLNHFPTGSFATCECGRTGCLMATAGDQAIARTAHAAKWADEPRIESVFRAAEAGSPRARAALTQRAGVLADVVAQVADMVEPDRVVIAGQAFSADPLVLTLARELIGPTVRVTRFGSAIQAHAACAIALQTVDANPLALAPRGRRVHRGAVGRPVVRPAGEKQHGHAWPVRV